ncbi:MAG TPA: MBL fold metallo-hydrolase [Bryobacteraceae bacterium]|jgi:glyoxylase-like metal-dependent hydrolase (beta-lactamase superfamily II)
MFVSTRRTFLTAAAAGLAAPFAFAQAPHISSAPLGDNLFLLSGAGANVIVRTGGAEGIVMVDGGLAQNADALAKAVAGLPNSGPVKTLFNTHWHPEQTGSNEKLGTAGATIIAQENTRLWLQQNVTWPWNGRKFAKLAKVAQPNKTFYDKATLGSGASEIRYGYVSDAAHTDGDMYVYFPAQNVLAVGGVAYGQGWPEVDWWTGGWIGGIVGGLQRIQTVANKDTKIIPAVGPALTLADIAAQVDMYGTIYDRLNQMMNKGRGPSEGVEAKPAKEYEAKMGNPDEFIRRSFESLWAYLSPDA